jgi:plasmid replication initiation protein
MDDAKELQKVYKSNTLVEAAYKLSLGEQRILLACIAKIDSRKPLPPEIKISAVEYADTYDLPVSQAYEALREASERMFERKIRLANKQQREERDIRWLQERAVYHTGQGAISLVFSDRVKRHISLLSGEFTRYQLERVSGLQSFFSVRLYEMLMRWRDTGTLIISLDDFKRRLGIEDKYPRFPDLKRRVIAPAVKELGQKSGLEIEWDIERERRAVKGLIFRFRERDQMDLDLDEPKPA